MEVLKREFVPENIKKNYAKIAWVYDLWSLLTESRAEKKVLEFLELSGKKKVLDVAVGTGRLFKKIVSQNKDGFTEGIDISPIMLKYAKKRMYGSGKTNFILKEGNAYDIQYKDNYFDAVVNNYMLDLLPEKDFNVIIGEFYRVLKPGGKVIISSMAVGDKWNNKLWFKISKYFPGLMTNCRPIFPDSYIRECGFKNIESVYITQNTFTSEIIKAEKLN